jgi:hypothetical protein
MSKRSVGPVVYPVKHKRIKMDDTMRLDPGPVQIDEDLHSRQLAVYGRESMGRMANAEIVIMGLKGLGVEVGACQSQAMLRSLSCKWLRGWPASTKTAHGPYRTQSSLVIVYSMI